MGEDTVEDPARGGGEGEKEQIEKILISPSL
jgi:hypothetical protein